MGFEPTYAERTGLAVQCLIQSATLSDQSSFVCYLNRTNKILKQRCSASNRIFCLLKTKKLSNQASARSKIDLTSTYLNCNDELAL